MASIADERIFLPRLKGCIKQIKEGSSKMEVRVVKNPAN